MKINENFRSIKESYLFSDIAHKVAVYQEAHPDKDIIRMGIGDVDVYKRQSESCALDSAGFRFIRDIDPGELVIVNKEGEITSYKLAVTAKGRGNKIAV